MTKDYLYENPPLIEVIAEVHWALKKIDTAPDARIDPFYDIFKDSYLEHFKAIGLDHIQELVPAVVPLEMLPDQPRLRLRSGPGKWPLTQIGPGVLTANIVPPYKGWAAFEPFLHQMIDALVEHYPLSAKTLQIERLHLRYIDGFDESFGLKKYSTFAAEMLGLTNPLPNKFFDENIPKGFEVTYLLENSFLNISPEGSSGKVKISPGRIKGKNALILELRCESEFSDQTATASEFVKGWFLEAHGRLRSQFEALTTPELEKIMGNKEEIG